MQKKEQISILQDIIKIKSVNGDERDVALYLQQLLSKNGINSKLVEFAANRCNLVAEIGSGTDTILAFSGHMDVVSPGDTTLWKYDPFSATIDGTKLYGRGSTDMKSGLAAMVLAMIDLANSKTPLKGTLRLLATLGEEIGELGAEQLTYLGYADDLTGLVIGEPTGYRLIYTHMGSIDYQVISIGKEAHSSMPGKGINAINNLTTFMDSINEKMTKIISDYDSQIFGKTIHNITVISGGDQVNSIPGKATLKGNIRSIPEFNNQQLIQCLQQTVDLLNKQPSFNLTLKIDYNQPPVEANKDSTLIKTIQQIELKKTGNILPLIGIAGTTDAAEFIKSKHPFDFVIFGPGETELAHQVNEFVEIENYLDMIDSYKQIAINYLTHKS